MSTGIHYIMLCFFLLICISPTYNIIIVVRYHFWKDLYLFISMFVDLMFSRVRFIHGALRECHQLWQTSFFQEGAWISTGRVYVYRYQRWWCRCCCVGIEVKSINSWPHSFHWCRWPTTEGEHTQYRWLDMAETTPIQSKQKRYKLMFLSWHYGLCVRIMLHWSPSGFCSKNIFHMLRILFLLLITF